MKPVLIVLALLAAMPAMAQQITADDCRAEFQANLARQGGYAPEAVARAGRPGTAEAIYNSCLAFLRGAGGDYRAARAERLAKPEPASFRRGPGPECARMLIAGNGYTCEKTRFGG